MAIPYNIDLPRFLGASFRQKWEGEFRPELLFERVGEQLGLPADECRSAWEAFTHKMVESVAKPLTTRQGMLRLHSTVKGVTTDFESWAQECFKDQEFRARVELFCQSHFAFSDEADEWVSLMHFVEMFWSVRRMDHYSQNIIHEIQVLTMGLIIEDKTKYLRAWRNWHPLGGTTEHDTKRFIQNVERVSHRAIGPGESDGDGPDRHEELVNLMDAWNIAYEGEIFRICCFLWLAKRDPSQPADLSGAPERGGQIQKGAVYNEVMEWCKNHDIEFPFCKRGVEIRNHVLHGKYLLDLESEMLFFLGSDMNIDTTITPISYSDLRESLLHDISVTNYFLVGRMLGELTVMNMSGLYDGAWGRFKSRIGDLTWVYDRSVDSGSPFGEPAPTHADVKAYLDRLSPTELAALIGDMRLLLG